MSESEGRENANLYMRGVSEGAVGEELDAQELLDVLDVFGEDGVRMYLVGVLEGIEDRAEEELEEYEMLRASMAFVARESSVKVLERSEDTLRVRVEEVPRDLDTGVDLHVLDDEDDIVDGGLIVAVEFEGAVVDDGEEPATAPAVVTVERWKYEFIEYEGPEDEP